jgi:hypothetical protein
MNEVYYRPGMYDEGSGNNPDRDAYNAKFIEDVLVYMSLSERRDWKVPDLKYFDGAIIGLESQMERILSTVKMKRREFDATLNKARGIRGSAIFLSDKQLSGDQELLGGRELPLSERLKLLPIINRMTRNNLAIHHQSNAPLCINQNTNLYAASTRIIEVRSVSLPVSGVAWSRVHNYYFNHGPSWYPLRSEKDLQGSSYETVALSMILGCTILAKNTWIANIRIAETMPSVGLYTDPTGIKDFLKFRDIADGKTRRDALINWVCQHWRQDRNDPEVEIYVREHLRGKETAQWHGMQVEIKVPPVARERVEENKRERTRLSAAGLTKRLRDHNRRRR